jgi:chromosomal replication initiator protein
MASIDNVKLTMKNAQDALKDLIEFNQAFKIGIDDILKGVSSYYNVSKKDILGSSRKSDIAKARQVAMYLSRDLTSLSTTEIGAKIGKRDHATVLHSYKKISNDMQRSDLSLFDEISNITKLVKEQARQAYMER